MENKIINPLKIINVRKCDSFGCGHFGASRGKRKHKGLDLLGDPGICVLAPITGHFTKHGYCYQGDMHYRYIQLENDHYRVRLFYVDTSIPVDCFIEKGERIGSLQDLGNRYPGIPNHLHLEVYYNGVLQDPAKFLNL